MLEDIKDKEDIKALVNRFYESVNSNEIIGHIFTEVVNVDWNSHLPIMYSFWSGILLHDNSYSGNPMIKHIELSKKTVLSEKQFSEWLRLFHKAVDELFAGPKAEEAKVRATNIAGLMLYKIQNA